MKNIYNHLFWTGTILVTFIVSFLILIGINIYPYVSDKLTRKNEMVIYSPVNDGGEEIFQFPQTKKDDPKETVIVKENPKPIQQVTKSVTVHDTAHDTAHDTVHDTVKIKSEEKDTISLKIP